MEADAFTDGLERSCGYGMKSTSNYYLNLTACIYDRPFTPLRYRYFPLRLHRLPVANERDLVEHDT